MCLSIVQSSIDNPIYAISAAPDFSFFCAELEMLGFVSWAGLSNFVCPACHHYFSCCCLYICVSVPASYSISLLHEMMAGLLLSTLC